MPPNLDPDLLERFKNHVVETWFVRDNMEVLVWSRPGRQLVDRLNFVRHNNAMMVYGDYGEWVFQLPWASIVEVGQRCDMHYLCEKILACRQKERYGWDAKKAKEAITDYFKQMDREERKQWKENDEVTDPLDHIASADEWEQWLRNWGQLLFCEDYSHYLYIGRVDGFWIKAVYTGWYLAAKTFAEPLKK